jgi:hypothetical protein
MKHWHIIPLFVSLAGLGTTAIAQTCCSGGVPLANNIGGLPLSAKHTWQFSLSGDMNVLKTLKEGSSEIDDDSRERKTYSILLKTAYTFTDKLFVESLLTWVQQERTISQPGNFTDFDQTRGLGDAALLINYSYFNTRNLTLIGGIGPKLPTGKADLKDDNGLTYNADLQPGSGAWDGLLLHRAQFANASRRSQLYQFNLTYRYTGKNKNYLGSEEYRFGNEFQMLSGVSDQFVIGKGLFSTGLTVRYRHVRQDQFNEQVLPNTGGEWIFLMPAIGWHIRSNFILGINSEFPLYANVDGTQLTPTVRVNGSIYYVLQKRLN